MIGDFKHRLTVQEEVLVPDGAGGFEKNWQDVAEVFAKIESTAHSAFFTALKNETRITHKITLRFRADLRPGMRAVKGGRVFVLLAVMDRAGDGRFVELYAEEETP